MRISKIIAVMVLCTISAIAQPFRSSQLISPGELFRRGMNAFAGTGPGRDDASGVSDIERSAQQGYAPAQTVLGYLYENGIYLTSYPGQAVQWYRKAAQQGDGVAQYALGRAYFLGIGVQSDKAEAQKSLKSASDQGNPFAQYLLGKLLEDRDYRSAPAEYRKAAEQGIPLAQFRLGVLLKEGRGIAVDKSEAYMWLLLAFEAGVKSAEGPLHELEGDLGSNGTEAAKSRAREMGSSVLRSVNAHGCDDWVGEFDEVPTVPPPGLQRFCR
jgi:TPR repeat protein